MMSDKEVIVSNEEIIWKWSYSIALIFLVFIISNIWNFTTLNIKVNGWSTVQGTVIRSEFEECVHNRSKLLIGTDGLLLSKISYRYSINNVTYTGNKIKNYGDNCEGNFYNEKAEKALEDKYRINENIRVYFNSKQPDKSFVFTNRSLGILDDISFIIFQLFLFFIMFVIIQDDIEDIKVLLKKDKKQLMLFLTKEILNILLIGWKHTKEFVNKHINIL
ncbi:MAG: DUF3592 domain-containing protein [Methylococcales bacterium]|jgi:Protein of unknown function (DUF3592)